MKLPSRSSGGARSTLVASAGALTHISGAAPPAQRLASAIATAAASRLPAFAGAARLDRVSIAFTRTG